MTTELANLPGIWLVRYVHTDRWQNGDDYEVPINLGAFPNIELATERIHQLLALAATQEEHTVWRPSENPNQPRRINLHRGVLALEWVPFYRTNAPGEAAVIQDRANELGLLSGDTLPQVLSVEEHVEQLRDYAMASYTLIVDHYTQFTLRSPVPAFLQ